MRTIYLDKEFKCHVSDSDQTYLKIQTDYFDGDNDDFVESHVYIPEGYFFEGKYGKLIYQWREPATVNEEAAVMSVFNNNALEETVDNTVMPITVAKIRVNGADNQLIQKYAFASGEIGSQIYVEFDHYWDDLSIKCVLIAGTTVRTVASTGKQGISPYGQSRYFVIPESILLKPYKVLEVGFIGYQNPNHEVVLTSTVLQVGAIPKSAKSSDGGDDGKDPVPDIVAYVGDKTKLETTCKEDLVCAINELNASIGGRVFDTESDMRAWLVDHSTELKVGENLYIRAMDTPDYWWDGNDVQILETDKVDLSGYYTSEQVDAITGDRKNLKTDAKTNLVDAINEVHDTEELHIGDPETRPKGTKMVVNPKARKIHIYDTTGTSDKDLMSQKGITDALNAKADGSAVPTKTSQLENDAGFVDSSALPTKVSQLENDSKFVDEQKFNEALSGIEHAHVFDTEEAMRTWLETHSSELKIGENLYIKALDTPDYWWDGTAPQILETEKVDLTEYYKSSQVDELVNKKADSTTVTAIADRVSANEDAIVDLTAAIPKKVSQLENDSGYLTDAKFDDNVVSPVKAWHSAKTANYTSKHLYSDFGPVTAPIVTTDKLAADTPIHTIVDIPVTQEGTGDPSPENVRPIVMQDKVELTRCGTNFIDTSELIGKTVNGERKDIKNIFLPSGTYWPRLVLENNPEEFSPLSMVLRDARNASLVILNLIEHPEGKFTITEELSKQIVSASVYTHGTIKALALSNDPNLCEPYTGSIYTAKLPEPVAGGVVDWEKGEFSTDVLFVEYDGSLDEPIEVLKYANGWGMYVKTKQAPKFPYSSNDKNAKSNYLTMFSGNESTVLNGWYLSPEGINVIVSETEVTIDQVRTMLKNKPIQLTFSIEKTVTGITPSSTPLALPGVNNIYSNVGDVTVSGYEDIPSKTIRDYTVELTCPEFSKTAPVVTCHPVENYPLHVVSEIAVKQERPGEQGTPKKPNPILMQDSVSLTQEAGDAVKTYTAQLSEPVAIGQEDWLNGEVQKTGHFLSPNEINVYAEYNYGDYHRFDSTVKASLGKNLLACSHLQIKHDWTSQENHIFKSSPSGGNIIFVVNRYLLQTDNIAGLKKWLADNKVQILLEGDKTVTSTISAKPTALPGTNNLYSSAGDTTVSGREDPLQHMKEMSDRITTLENNKVKEI